MISAPLFGAIAAAGGLPFTRPVRGGDPAGRRGRRRQPRRLRGGIRGQHCSSPGTNGKRRPLPIMTDTASLDASRRPPQHDGAEPAPPRAHASLPRRSRRTVFPAASHAVLNTAVVRLTDYQDVRYAAEYLAASTPFVTWRRLRRRRLRAPV